MNILSLSFLSVTVFSMLLAQPNQQSSNKKSKKVQKTSKTETKAHSSESDQKFQNYMKDGDESELVPAMEVHTLNQETDTFNFVEELPLFPGGQEALMKFWTTNLIYPDLEKENGVQGNVYVSFVVNKLGEVVSVKVIRGVSKGLDNEAIRVVKMMPKWRPGKQNGKIVNTRYNLPVRFKLR